MTGPAQTTERPGGRRRLWIAVAALVTAIAIVVVGAVYRHRSADAVTVGPDGGTFRLGELTVSVPAGAVRDRTRLSGGQPAAIAADQPGPLPQWHVPRLRFELALGGDVQPLLPIAVSVRLAGRWLPPGASAREALLYTGGTADRDYRLVAADVDDSGVLRAELWHLSAKFLAFAGPVVLLPGLRALAARATGEPAAPPECPQDAETPALGPIKLAPGTGGGWSTAADSPVRPCLRVDGGSVDLVIANGADYVWSLFLTHDLTVEARSDDAENEVVKALTARLYPNLSVQGYLSRGDRATVPLSAAALPATVQLQASPSTFLAEIVWIATKFLAGLFLGTDESETVRQVKALIELPQVLSCLGSTVRIGNGAGSPEDVFNAVVSQCTEKLADALGDLTADAVSWKRFWQRWLTPAGGVKDALSAATTAYTGIGQQIRGPVTVTVQGPESAPVELTETAIAGFSVNGPSDAAERRLRAALGPPQLRDSNGACSVVPLPPEARRTLTWGALSVTIRRPGRPDSALVGWTVSTGSLPANVRLPYGVTTATPVRQAMTQIPHAHADWNPTFEMYSITTDDHPELVWSGDHEDGSGAVTYITDMFEPCD
nr:hypothetical protein GCM10020063_010430 [Dactylosporangium thailandense]